MATIALPFTKSQSQSNEMEVNQSQSTGWDEEIVPALKKRLEADRNVLQNRINGYDFEKASKFQSSTKPRPIPRRNGHDEILQDGLGDDELIPSEWATGSNARFLTASSHQSRSASEKYTMTRSTSGSDVYYDHQSNFRTPPNSPPSQDMINTTTTNSAIITARERARRLARERQRALEEGMDVDGYNGRSENAPNGESRSRTISTPGLLKGYDDVGPTIGKREDSGGILKEVRNQSSQRSLRAATSPIDGQTSPSSRIPLPVSGSMNKIAASNSSRSVRGYNESGNVESPHPDGLANQSLNSPNRTVTKKNTTSPKSITNKKAMQNSPPTQDVLDEFGPLGGTKRSQLMMMDTSMNSGTGEFGDISRTSSNPWDEELLPTVKRRLLQEAMMKDPRMSGVEGLIDTWDRNGVPISTTSINSLARNGNGNENGQMEKEGDESEMIKKDDSAINEDHSTDSQSERMKRLTDQLDLGFRSNSAASGLVGNTAGTGEKDNLNESGIEMKNLRMNMRSREQNEPNKKSSLPHLTTTQQLSHSATTTTTTNKPTKAGKFSSPAIKDDDQGAGCCQCTVM